jgi:hypothetical protein
MCEAEKQTYSSGSGVRGPPLVLANFGDSASARSALRTSPTVQIGVRNFWMLRQHLFGASQVSQRTLHKFFP